MMKKNKTIPFFVLLILSATISHAQPATLVSPCNGTFSRGSLLFDLQATNNLILDSIAILSQNCGTRNFKVYYKQGTYLGFNSTPGAWTLLDSTTNFTPSCALSCPIPPSVIPVSVNLCMAAGQTYGIYIAMTGGSGTIESHNLLPSGGIAVQDANLKLITGEGHTGLSPFNVGGTLVTGLTMQGEFHYHLSTLSLGNDTMICNGDSLLLNAGSQFNTFQWNTGATTQSIYVSNPGSYSVLVDSGNCQAFDSITISFQSCGGLTANLASSDTSFCEKKCLDFFDLSTNNPTSWLWLFPGADSLTSTLQNPTGICYSSYGSFDVTLIACNSTVCDTLFLPGFINEFQNPSQPLITASFDTLFSTPAVAYQWYTSSGPVPGATLPYFVFPAPGSYYVVVTDSNGCATASNFFITSVDYPEDFTFQLFTFPNPSTGNFYITHNFSVLENVMVEIFDNLGRKRYHKIVEKSTSPIYLHTNFLPDGVYVLRLINGKKAMYRKIIISK